MNDPVIISYYDEYSDSTEQSGGAENSSESKDTSFPSKTLTFDTTDADGYKIVQTINAGYWIKASDQAALDKAWKQAGGNGNPPTVHQISRFASKADSVIAFGNISLQNSTSGFDITESNPRSVNLIGIEVEKRDADSSNQWWIQDYDGVFDLSGSLTPFRTVTNPVRVEMKSNNLGPIPFAIILPDVFTPRNGADGMKLMNYIDLAIGNHDPKEHFSLPVSW